MIRLFFFCLLLFFGSAFALTVNQLPAFNAKLRGDTVLGSERTPIAFAMYDRGDYEYQRGYGFLAADLLLTDSSGETVALLNENFAAQNARKAQKALRRATRLDPGNGHAWVSLAWAEASLGHADAALKAVRVSWRVAPNNSAMAESRLNLMSVLTDPQVSLSHITDDDRSAVRADVGVLRSTNENSAAFLLASSPHLADISEH